MAGRDNSKDNFARVCRLIVDVFRGVLVEITPNGLRPIVGCDITTLYTIIRNCSVLSDPAQGWGKLPSPGDVSTGDDVERIRLWRNEVYGHAEQALIQDEEFQLLVDEMKAVTKRIDSTYKSSFTSQLEKVLSEVIDGRTLDIYQEYVSALTELKQRDDKLEHKLATFERKRQLDNCRAEGRMSVMEADIKRRKETKENVHDEKDVNEYLQFLIGRYVNSLSEVTPCNLCDSMDSLEMFVPLTIREDMENWLSKKSKKRTNRDNSGKGKGDIMVSNYRDVFHREGKPQRMVFLLGDAGIGKSTFCHRLVNLWCNLKSAASTNDPDEATETFGSDRVDKEMLAEMDFVFLVRCRFAKENQTVLDMVKHQLCIPKYEGIVDKIFISCPEKFSCLVIIDGLDEWIHSASDEMGVMDTKGIPTLGADGCFTLITSRHWRVEALDSIPSCTVLEILGLRQNESKYLSCKVLKALGLADTESQLTKHKEFKKLIEKDNMQDLVKVPILLIILLQIWYSNHDSLDRSICRNYSSLIELVIDHSEKRMKPTEKYTFPEQNSFSLPESFKGRALCQKYSNLLRKLSKLSFQTLVTEKKECFLVFSKREMYRLVKDFTESEIEMSFKLGLLSRSKVKSAQAGTVDVKVSFLHKSVHEFLGALHFSGGEFESCLEIFKRCAPSLREVFEYEPLLVFLCGLAPEKGHIVCSYVISIINASTEIQTFRRVAHMDLFPEYVSVQHLAKQCQRILLRCISESDASLIHIESNKSSSCSAELNSSHCLIHIPDVLMDKHTSSETIDVCFRHKEHIKTLVHKCRVNSQLHQLVNIPQLEKLAINFCGDDRAVGISQLINAFSYLSHLKAVSLHTDPLYSLSTAECSALFQKLNRLEHIASLSLARLHVPFDVEDVCHFPSKVTSLHLQDLPVSHKLVLPRYCTTLYLWKVCVIDSLVLPSSCTTVTMEDMFISGLSSPLPEALVSLTLYGVVIKYTVLQRLCVDLKACPALKTLKLILQQTPSEVLLSEQLDLTSNPILETLSLSFLSLDAGVSVNQNMNDIDLRGVTMSQSNWSSLVGQLYDCDRLTAEFRSVLLDQGTIDDICRRFSVTGSYPDNLENDRRTIQFQKNITSD